MPRRLEHMQDATAATCMLLSSYVSRLTDLAWLKALIAAASAGLAGLLGGWDSMLSVLITLMALDYLGGVLHALESRKLDSAIGFRGIVKKVGYLMLVVLACMFDTAMQLPAPLGRTLVILFLIANESLSIIEHLGQLGVPIPAWLIDRLRKLQEETNAGNPPTNGQG